ncbi:MAG: T9SS type A sorting domain-containing protein [Bacteroidetes bacterium]|nr:T9SS type A sorting domain-containing protein [Bacteroidota bacterium]
MSPSYIFLCSFRARKTAFDFVQLKVYDVLGNEVATLVNKELQAGENELEFNTIGLPGGVYFYTVRVRSFIETKKMVLVD